MSDVLYSTPEIPLKRCSKGDDCLNPDGCWQPETAEFFRPRKDRGGKLRTVCRFCERGSSNQWNKANPTYIKQWRDDNPDKIKGYARSWRGKHEQQRLEYNRSYRAQNPDKWRSYQASWNKNNRDKAREYERRDKQKHPERVRAKSRRHYEKHRTAVLEKNRKYRIENADRIRETQVRYYASNSDLLREKSRKWAQENRDKRRVAENRRRANKRFLPKSLTPRQWQRALDYFDHRCAVCGRPAGLWHRLSLDHWIPLSDRNPDNPGTSAVNAVPLCSGINGCNESKNDTHPAKWLSKKFGKRKASLILNRIGDYFDWVKEQDGEG